MTHEAHEYLRRRLHGRFIPYNPTIIDGKLFVTTAQEVTKEDDD